MKICVVGCGYVGLSLAILLSQKSNVAVLDIDDEKINNTAEKGVTYLKFTPGNLSVQVMKQFLTEEIRSDTSQAREKERSISLDENEHRPRQDFSGRPRSFSLGSVGESGLLLRRNKGGASKKRSTPSSRQ